MNSLISGSFETQQTYEYIVWTENW